MKTAFSKLLMGAVVSALILSSSIAFATTYVMRMPIKGLVATSTSASPAPTDPDFANVAMLMHFDNSAADAKGNNVANNGVAFSGTVSKFGGYSAQFNGASYMTAANNGAFDLGTGDFTIEFWMKSTQNTGSFVAVVGTQSIAGHASAGMWRVSSRMNSTNQLGFNYSTGGTFVDDYFNANVNDGAWHFVAMTRAAGTLRCFVDGAAVGGTFTVAQSLSSQKNLNIGYQPQDNVYYSGNVDDLRITKGLARYTASFTPPTAAFPNQ